MAHANWKFSYAGIEFPVPDADGVVETQQPIDVASTNANQDTVMDYVGFKRTIQYRNGRLTGDEAHLILSTIKNNRIGKLTYYSIMDGDIITIDVYPGAGIPITYNIYNDDMEKQMYTSLSINFIGRLNELTSV